MFNLMREFPLSVQRSMRRSGAAATCVPVKLDSPDWETAFFVHVAGPECKQDRRTLKTSPNVAVAVESELMTHARASIVLLRLEIGTVPADPLSFEILLAPGHVTGHFEALKLLSTQPRLTWFFGDGDYRVLRTLQHDLSQVQQREFDTLCKDAFSHDATLRMAGQYDAEAALAEIVAHYTPREGLVHGENPH